ncbi:MAG: TonB family protein [Sandaracinaceae bacterium]|nr:TonB family protein [Sandaracinaceae bacterium]
MTLPRGAIVAGKYRVERLLGEGGMGTVYVATNERLQKEVALKVLSPGAATSPEAAVRLTREAIAASRVKHPGIVEIYDADVHEGQPWIAMELLHGETLGQRLERGALPPVEALDVALETLAVLEPVHRAGIVHRDLKPDNLFFDRQADGRSVLKVLDFGIAKVVGADIGSTTRTGMAMGTPFFLAPEQARNAKDVDPRADLYAVGVILYHSLTGALPYEADSFGDLIAQMFSAGPRSLAAVAPSTPPELVAVIDRCLAVDREQRPPSARALADELARLRGRLTGVERSVAPTLPLAPGAAPLAAPDALPYAATHRMEQGEPWTEAPSLPTHARWPWMVGGLAVLLVAGAAVTLGALSDDEPRVTEAPPTVAPPEPLAPAPEPAREVVPPPEPVRPPPEPPAPRVPARSDVGGSTVAEPVAPGAVQGSVRAGALEDESGSGVFDPSLVTRQIQARSRSLQACYERELRQNPTLAGRVLVRFTIQPSGVVTGATATQNGTGSPAVAACVVSMVSAFRFNPGPEGGSVTFTYPFVFGPGR